MAFRLQKTVHHSSCFFSNLGRGCRGSFRGRFRKIQKLIAVRVLPAKCGPARPSAGMSFPVDMRLRPSANFMLRLANLRNSDARTSATLELRVLLLPHRMQLSRSEALGVVCQGHPAHGGAPAGLVSRTAARRRCIISFEKLVTSILDNEVPTEALYQAYRAYRVLERAHPQAGTCVLERIAGFFDVCICIGFSLAVDKLILKPTGEGEVAGRNRWTTR